ncbi:MAG TPA: hypothetical protein VJU81_05405, partial [Methylomirabilota bacterium]|nr:hypothetical protein [Methylomirabilota bacterium]
MTGLTARRLLAILGLAPLLIAGTAGAQSPLPQIFPGTASPAAPAPSAAARQAPPRPPRAPR